MSVSLGVLIYPHELLSKPATKKVGKPSHADVSLANEMARTMFAMSGVGLAAPQVGVDKRIIVVDMLGFGQHTTMFDPVIVKTSGESAVGMEGCLSVPGITLLVERSTVIAVAFTGEDGKKHRLELQGYAARVVQHEVDHLDGITILERSKNLEAL